MTNVPHTPGWITTPCVTCQAKAGERCINRAGHEMIGFIHIERVRASLRARK